ncbi:hypothetical protein WA158_004908 [Blastocystis sp. Blastoise]
MYNVMRNISAFLQAKTGLRVSPQKIGRKTKCSDVKYEQGISPLAATTTFCNRAPNTPLSAPFYAYENAIKNTNCVIDPEKSVALLQADMASSFASYCAQFTLPNGLEIFIRPILPVDKLRMKEVLSAGQVSQKSLNFRFNSVIQKVSESALDYLTVIDYDRHVAFVALAKIDGEWKGIGSVRLIQDEIDSEYAEWAAIVCDKYHGEGIGSCLLYFLSFFAQSVGIRHLGAVIHPDNVPVLHWMKKLGSIRQQRNGCSYWVYDTPIYPQWISDDSRRVIIENGALGKGNLQGDALDNMKQTIDSLKTFHALPQVNSSTSLYTSQVKHPKVTYISKSCAVELESDLELGDIF